MRREGEYMRSENEDRTTDKGSCLHSSSVIASKENNEIINAEEVLVAAYV